MEGFPPTVISFVTGDTFVGVVAGIILGGEDLARAFAEQLAQIVVGRL